MHSNCGLLALEKVAELKEVSMFTLIHLAKDNGITLYFCKVEPEELVQVARPAIFHQPDHFVFVDNGEPMPEGDYDGYVLTQRPLHEPLPYSLSKKIKGQKGGGGGWWKPVAIGVASLINPMLGAAVGAGLGGATAAGAFGDEGKNEWWRIATGGLSGYSAISNPMMSGLSAAAGALPGAIKTGNYMAPISAGLMQYGVGKMGGALQSSGFMGLGGSTPTGAQTLASGGMGPTGAGGVGIAPSIPTPAGYSGTYTVPGMGSSIVGLPGQGPVGIAASSLASGASAPAASGGSDFFNNILGKTGLSKTQLFGMGASTLLSPPKYEGNVSDNFSKAAQYLGMENYQALPEATRNQLEKYVNTPLDQLAQEFYAPDDKGIRTLEENKQKAIDQAMVSYANYGQDPYTSSQAQQQLTEINRQYDQAVAEYEQQIQNQAMQQAIAFKQDILAKAMQQGQFDYESAMELATYIGQEQQLKYAYESKNYEALQDVLAQIFSIGQYNQNRQGSNLQTTMGG